MAAKKSKQFFSRPGEAWADVLFREAREEARKQAIKEAVELYRRYPNVINGFDSARLNIHLSREDLERLSKEK